MAGCRLNVNSLIISTNFPAKVIVDKRGIYHILKGQLASIRYSFLDLGNV